MNHLFLSSLLICTLILSFCGSGFAQPPVPEFDRTIAPLLVRRCLDCHSGAAAKGGLNLTSKKAALAGGDDGPPLIAGNPDESLLWRRVRDGEMPPKKPLPAEDKE